MMQGATTLAATRSPLDKLVRQQSKRAAQRPPAPPAVVISPDVEPYRYGNDGGADSAHDSPASYASQPLSPLLHTRFGRDTARYSDVSDRSSPGSFDDRNELDSAHRPFSHLATLSPDSASTPTPSRAPDSPVLPPSPGLDVPARTPPRRSDVDPFAFRNYESQQHQHQQQLPPGDFAPPRGAVPAVILNDEGTPRESRHRVPVQIAQDTRPRYNFSRPLRRQEPPPVPDQPPPPPPVSDSAPPSPTSSAFLTSPSHNPYMRQSPASSPSQRPPSPDRDSYLAYDAPDPLDAQDVEVAEEALFRSPSSTRRHPYAYASGSASSSNYEYDEAASPVEISPITPRGPPQPTQHTFSSPDKNVTTPWARLERRKTLPPQGGLELQLDEHDEEEGAEDAMAFHAAAFSSAGSDLDAPAYDDGTMRSHATARSSAFSTALPSLGRSSYDDDDERRGLSPQLDDPTPVQHSFPPSQLPQQYGYPDTQQPYPGRGSPQHHSRGPSPQPQQPRGSSPQPPRGPSPQPVQQVPPPPPEPIDTRQSTSTRADRGVSYYSTTSSYFPPPSAHPTNFVPLPGAPPPAHRPGSSASLYSNYSYYNIPPSPTGSGGSREATPTEERFGATLAPTASGRDDRGRLSPNGGRMSPSGGRTSPVAGPSYPSYGAGPSNYGSPNRGQQYRPGPNEAGLLAARDIVGRTSEDTVRDASGSRGWFGRRHPEQREREPRPSHESGASSTGRRSPTGSAFSHKQYFPTLPNPSPDTLRAGTAQEFLALGITAHEALRLPESAYCFEQASTLNGGCAVGMLMWGLALRHGWGVRRNEKDGFKWLRRAAGRAVEGLEAAARGEKSELEGVKTELVLAIYEVGQCFFHGWGVTTDRKMAVSYYQVAARLGDADAQQALAFCYANGRGTKKDLKESAKWYRAAAAQGASTVGLAWIYKTKYGAEEDADGRPALR